MEMTGSDGRATGSAGSSAGELRTALDRIEREVREGLAHGFFELTVACEVVAGRKRQLTIRSGKSYRHVIPPGESGA